MGRVFQTPSTHLAGRVGEALLRIASFLAAPGRYTGRAFVASPQRLSIFKTSKLPPSSVLRYYLRVDKAVYLLVIEAAVAAFLLGIGSAGAADPSTHEESVTGTTTDSDSATSAFSAVAADVLYLTGPPLLRIP